MENAKEIWDSHWSKYEFQEKLNTQIIRQEESSVRWKKIEKNVFENFGSFKGLNVIEIGSGRGEVAAVMALRGARISLLDYSQAALDKARSLFKDLGIDAAFIHADAFDLPENLLNSFDISMSFGLAEHFQYPLRQDIMKAHLDLVKPEGESFVAVPNAQCLPYRFFMKLSDVLGYASGETEIPFSRSELSSIAASIGFKEYHIAGSSFIRDAVYFLCARYISYLTRWKYIPDISIFEIPTVLDDYFGYSLVLVGRKNEN